MFDDIVYYTTLILCIPLGHIYKKIKDVEVKRQLGTGVGFLVAFLLCGRYFFHMILMVWLNTAILKCCDKRYVHKVSLVYTWLHLLYLHINVMTNPHYVILLHQIIALRLVGMATEMNMAAKQQAKPSTSSLQISSGDNVRLLEPTTADIVSYVFCFIGLHKGPYYRYTTYEEQLNGSFGNLGDFRLITEQKLKKIFVCLVLFSLLRMKYTPEIYFNESFYKYDTETRYLYNVPLLCMYFLKSVITMLLCACVCTEAGFGVYPSKMVAIPGHGPSARHSLFNMSTEEALQQEYNFAMLKCFNSEKLLIGPRMKDTVQSWDMPVRYWFIMNIHKNMFNSRKDIGSICSYLAWTLWRGPSLQQIIISSTLWVYIHLEAEYGELYNTTGQMKLPWDIGFSIMRIFCLIYLTPCFILQDASTVFRYYNSIFWVFHGILLVLIVGAIVINKSRQW